jgi:pimeloyl-ACP methyl ester carboxylesterase
LTTFCLIHGSGQDSRVWQLLEDDLRARGHVVVTPNMPANEPDAGAQRYAMTAADSLSSSGVAVLVAHSASGLLLPFVAALVPTTLMVFLAAAIPVPGKSFLDQLAPDPTVMFNPGWIGQNPVEDDDAAVNFLFHDCPPDVASWALSIRVDWYPEGLYEEPCPLVDWPDTPSSYVLCTEDRTIRPEWSRRAARERLGVEAIELPGGHCPHVSRPADLASVLVSLL